MLHAIHAANWGEHTAAPDEPARMDAIARRVEALLSNSVAVCLQDFSGDQLRALTAPHTHAFALPRVPRPRGEASTLVDPTEHIVIASALAPGEVVEQRAFATDPGKGFIAVRLNNGIIVVSTHVSSASAPRASSTSSRRGRVRSRGGLS